MCFFEIYTYLVCACDVAAAFLVLQLLSHKSAKQKNETFYRKNNRKLLWPSATRFDFYFGDKISFSGARPNDPEPVYDITE